MSLGHDTNRGAKRARETRAELGLAPDEPLTCVLEVVEGIAGVWVAVLDLHEGFAGAYLRKGERRFLFVNLADAVVRKRFSLAHELGHVRLGHEPIVETWEQMYAHDRPPTEVQANAFAAEFLAPKAGVLRWWEEEGGGRIDLETVVRLAARFGMSAKAARYRLNTVGVLDDDRLAVRLDGEIDAGHHERLGRDLDLELVDDGLARGHGHGPHVPGGADGGLLTALLLGEVAVARAAEVLGQEPAHLREVIEESGIPCVAP